MLGDLKFNTCVVDVVDFGCPGIILEVIVVSWSTLKHQKAPQRPTESERERFGVKKTGDIIL